jgi:hypothetical protein
MKMRMKTLIFGLLLSYQSFGQNASLKFEYNKNFPNYLFRGIEYQIDISSKEYKETRLYCVNCIAMRNQSGYTIINGKSDTTYIEIKGTLNTTENAKLLSKIAIPIYDIPEIVLYLDSVQSGERITGNNSNLNCNYPKYSGLDKKTEILSWELKINGMSLKGLGTKLSLEAKEAIDNLEKGNSIMLIAEVKNINQTEPKLISGVFFK